MYMTLRTRTVLLSKDDNGKLVEVSRRQDVFETKGITVWQRELLKGETGDYVAVSTPQDADTSEFKHFQDLGLDVIEVAPPAHELVHHYRDRAEMMDEWDNYFQ